MNHADIVKLPLTCDSLYAYIIDESLLIYSQKTQNVYGFEKGSAALFLQIDELVGAPSCEEITEQFPAVDTVLLKKMYDLAACKEVVDVIEYEADMDLGTYIKDDMPRTYYQVDDTAFAVHYPDNFSKYFHPVYEHLHVEKPDAKTIVSVDFVKSDDLWEIHWNNTPVEMAIPKPQLATYLQEKMMTCTYQAQRYLISLHAASVEKNGKVIIMPAVAESSKTTLTATLLHHGFKLFSDESTSLDHEGYVHPLPFCMNIKEGSWSVLAPMYPHLSERDIHSRFDGQSIRFLPPENMHKGRQKASHIIFPKYTPGAKTSLIAISAREALSKINEASYQVQDHMDENKFELILENLISLPKYTLEYSDLDQAVATINGLLEA
jgi:hypothetical protein